MQPIKRIFVVLFCSIVFYAASTVGETMSVNGKLIYTTGGGNINAINFNPDGFNALSLYKSVEVAAIDHLTRANNDTVLFGECPITEECIIKQYSVDTGKSRSLRTGRLPSYIQNHNKLFFYDKATDGSNWLFVSPVKKLSDAIKITKEPKWKTLSNGIKQSITIPVIQISHDDIIFVGEDEQLWLYSMVDKKLVSMGIKDCRPTLWIGKHNQLLCSDWNTWSPFLLDLSTKRKIEISELKGAYGFVYVPESDALIYGRTRSKYFIGEAYDIFYYSFADKKENKIKNDSHMAAGVWFKG